MIMAACSKEVEVNNPQPEAKSTYEFTIAANMVMDEDTKTSYTGETTFSWSEGDQISVLFHDTGDNNAFYTLTATSVDGANATFSGTIDSGWEVGAADTGDKWALYPAGSHSYTATAPIINLSDEVDFSATHFSANIPMYAIGEDNGAGTDVYAFKYLTNVGAYKFTFNNLDVSKVRLVVEQKGSYHISGDFQIAADGTKYNISPWTYSFSTDPGKVVTMTANVTSKTASFYIPFKTWEGNFQPVLTLYDAVTGYTIKQVTAKTTLPYVNGNKVIVVQPFSAPGVGKPFDSAFGVDWMAVGGELDGPTGSHSGMSLKGTKDADYIYVLCKIDKTKLLTGWHYSNAMEMYLGKDLNEEGEWKWTPKRSTDGVWIGYITRESLPYTGSSNFKSYEVGDYYFTELRYLRSNKTYLASGTAYVGVLLWNDKYNDGTNDLGAGSTYLFSPATSTGYLEIDLD